MVTINKALDNLIDALAGSDVPVTGSKATRVDQLAEMIADGEITIGGGGGGYDLVIKLDSTDWGLATAATLVGGSYAAATAKALEGKPLTAVVYGGTYTAEEHTMMTWQNNSFVGFSDYGVDPGEDYSLGVTVIDGESNLVLAIASDDSVTIVED